MSLRLPSSSPSPRSRLSPSPSSSPPPSATTATTTTTATTATTRTTRVLPSSSTVSSLIQDLLQDLIQTEKIYVDDLSVIIKILAGQFTPQDLPPPLLDHHFRLSECFYRCHKSLLTEMTGSFLDHHHHHHQQSSPTSSNQLMSCFYQFDHHFSNQLEAIYNRYCSPHLGWSAKADWNRILRSTSDHEDNHPIHSVLKQITWPGSIPIPPDEIFPGCPYSPDEAYFLDSQGIFHPTLLTFFALPFARLVYYSRLYHKLGSLINSNHNPNHHHNISASLLSCTSRKISSLLDSGASLWNSNSSSKNTSMVQISPRIFVQQAVLDLERTLDTSRCLDIFTMSPKPCKLHMAPPNLAFSRSIRLTANASFYLCPKSNPSTHIHTSHGLLILLTDLLLFCDQTPHSNPRPFLMYPPLATKHLGVSPHPQHASQFDILILRKESISVTVSSQLERDRWLLVLAEAIRHNIPCTTDLIPSPPHHLKMNTFDLARPPTPPPISAIPRPLPNTRHTPTDDPHSVHQTSNPTPCPPSQQVPLSRRPSPSDPVFRRPSAPNLASHTTATSPPPPPPLQQPRSYQLTDQPISVASPASRTDYQKPLPSRSMPSHSASSSRPSSPPEHPSLGSASQRPINHASSSHILRKAPSAHALGYPLPSDPRRPPPLPIRTTGLTPALTVPHPTSSGTLGASISRPNSTDPASSASERQYRSPSLAVFDRANVPGRLPSSQPFAAPSAHGRPSASTPGSQRSSAVSYASASLGVPPPPTLVDRHIDDAHDDDDGNVDDDDDDDDNGDDPSGSRAREGFLKPKLEPTLLTSMKTKLFLKQSHAQWKSLGTGKLLVFLLKPGNGKQLVVEQDDKKQKGKTIISTMVLSDGIERVGRTGVAVDLSDELGRRTGIVYMLQLKTETSAIELFEQLLKGSDRRPST